MIVDASSIAEYVSPMTNIPFDAKREKRQAQLREAQQRRREKLALEGSCEVRIRLTPAEFAAFIRQRDKANCPTEDFARLALTRGAAFVANAGNSKGGKVKEKGTK
jgi:hypothetical protein